MAQLQKQSQRNPNLDIFIPPDTFFGNTETWNSPGMPPISTNSRKHDNFPSTNPNLFPGHETDIRARQSSALQAPFSVNLGNETNSKLQEQSNELVTYLLGQAAEQWEIARNTTKEELGVEVEAALRVKLKAELKAEIIKELKAEIRREMIPDIIGEVKAEIKAEVERISWRLSGQMKDAARVALRDHLKALLLTPFLLDSTKTP